jgi:hypothetical protein
MPKEFIPASARKSRWKLQKTKDLMTIHEFTNGVDTSVETAPAGVGRKEGPEAQEKIHSRDEREWIGTLFREVS